MSGVAFPQELLDNIIDQLSGDNITLASCAIVAKNWTHRSQRNSRLTIRVGQSTQSDVAYIGLQSQILRKRFKIILLDGSKANLGRLCSFLQPLIDLIQRGVIAPDTLTLRNIHWEEPVGDADRNLITTIPGIRELNICDPTKGTLIGVASLLGSYPDIRTFRLWGRECFESLNTPPTPLTLPFLHTLSINLGPIVTPTVTSMFSINSIKESLTIGLARRRYDIGNPPAEFAQTFMGHIHPELGALKLIVNAHYSILDQVSSYAGKAVITIQLEPEDFTKATKSASVLMEKIRNRRFTTRVHLSIDMSVYGRMANGSVIAWNALCQQINNDPQKRVRGVTFYQPGEKKAQKSRVKGLLPRLNEQHMVQFKEGGNCSGFTWCDD